MSEPEIQVLSSSYLCWSSINPSLFNDDDDFIKKISIIIIVVNIRISCFTTMKDKDKMNNYPPLRSSHFFSPGKKIYRINGVTVTWELCDTNDILPLNLILRIKKKNLILRIGKQATPQA